MFVSLTKTIINTLRPALFSEIYHFNTGIGGLAYIGIGLGFLSATIFGAKLSDKLYLYVCHNCFLPSFYYIPEGRLIACY